MVVIATRVDFEVCCWVGRDGSSCGMSACLVHVLWINSSFLSPWNWISPNILWVQYRMKIPLLVN